MTEIPKALPGDVPERKEPKLREHDWGTGGRDRFGTPSWVNDLGSGKKTCSRCGCEEVNDVIMVDVKIVKGTEYMYRTVTGKLIRSLKPLSCPLFGFDEMSAAMDAKEIGREAKIEAEKVDIRVDATQYRIQQLEAANLALHSEFEARLLQLEAENRALQERVGSVTQIDLGMLAQKLLELAQTGKEQHALESITSGDRVLQIPRELREVIDVVGIPVVSDEGEGKTDND